MTTRVDVGITDWTLDVGNRRLGVDSTDNIVHADEHRQEGSLVNNDNGDAHFGWVFANMEVQRCCRR
ncbi:hypothetical protein ACLOJK_029747 [Asimina triloba]